MVVIWIYIEHEENVAIIEKGKAINVFVIKYIFVQREVQMGEVLIDVSNNMRIIINIIWRSGEGKLARIIWSAYNAISFFIGGTQNSASE